MMKKGSIATFSTNQKHSSKYGVRSISLPTRSHPSTIQIEEELIKLKSWETSSTSKVETICFGLSGLTELYKCIEHLLKLPLTQQALSQHKNEKWVDELLDFPLRFLDLLSKTRDDVLLMKGKVEELQSVLRRRKVGDMENHVAEYWCLRRKMRKECTKSLLLLKQIDGSIGSSFFSLDLNNHLCSIVKVLIEASLITSSILQSLVVFLSSPILRSKVNKWSLVSRLMQKGVFGCDNQNENINELEKVDFGVSSLMIMENEAEKIQSAHGRLEALVVAIEGIENGLECLFKRLINTRVSFLNIISP
ncbi:hypothetical protein MtrunA17_Chr8g0370921 [Medicago truncatula]|uniref:DUF241 domain protein n=1 Tax=Medicago truncatula TaxID=3880 RepID=G7LA88_MEDTR|nr:uncharacterized protein LOC11444314 [Medicago truncatula]AET03679.1 DUF241 domain protein [Medicago truncatula]RHN41898.1 hypothetical protein MtrunA17_Chr8g0370921 [Medicago truncatula]